MCILQVLDLVGWMVSHNFEDRPSIDDILIHPFLWSNTKRVMYLTDVGNKIDQHKELLEDVCWSCGKYNTYMLLFFPSYDYQHLIYRRRCRGQNCRTKNSHFTDGYPNTG